MAQKDSKKKSNVVTDIDHGANTAGATTITKVQPTSKIQKQNVFISGNISGKTGERLFGCIDSIDQAGVKGWIIDVSAPSKQIRLSAYIRKNRVGQVVANIFRPDISEIVKSPAYCGFHLKWDKNLLKETLNDMADDQPCPVLVIPEGEALAIAITATLIPSVHEAKSWLGSGIPDGYLECMDENLVVMGWAVAPSQDSPALVELQLNGEAVAQQTATLPRPDFIGKHSDKLHSGFKIALPRASLSRLAFEIEARVDGFLLPNSPVKVDFTNKLTIKILGIKNQEIQAELTGWPGAALDGELHVDGRYFSTINFNPSSESQGGTYHCAGRLALPPQFVDGQPHVYFVCIREGEAVVRSDARVIAYPTYSVHIDWADFNRIVGWAFRHDRKNPLTLSITSPERTKRTFQTQITRDDVLSAFPNAIVTSGFALTFPVTQLSGAISYILQDEETGITLARVSVASPYDVMCELAYDMAKSDSETTRVRLQTVMSKLVMRSGGGVEFTSKTMPPPQRAQSPAEIDVIIPVYGGVAETMECIESVLAAKNETPSRIVIVNDCTPDSFIKDYLNDLEKRGHENLLIIHRTINGGFSEAVNIGMIVAADRDVILLNADTVVQSGWIDRLVSSAKSDPRIGTVTPLSNNAEICTVPYQCKSLPVANAALAQEVDRVAATVNAGKYVDIPVAIGFCMYIRRQCLDEIGLFDAATWGRGYGEEVDFCLKATAQGWRHIMTGDTFIVHRGNVSFGDEKLERIKESAKKISARYPFYDQLIQRFIFADPGATIRRAINLALINAVLPSKRILHVTHGFGGGTEQYIEDMSALNIEAGYTPIVLRFNDTGKSELDIELTETRLSGFFADQHREIYSENEIEALKSDIDKLGIERLHLHAPFGMPMHLLEWLTDTYPTIITIHDYAWICPRVTLTTPGGRYCQEPPVEQCRRCIDFFQPHTGLQHFVEDAQGDIAQYRKAFSRILAKAETVIAGARDVVQRMEHHGMQADYKIVPHPTPRDSVFNKQVKVNEGISKNGIVKVALIGGISEIKGYHQLVECAMEAERRRLPIEFIVFGITVDDSQLARYSNVTILGAYKEDELEELMLVHRPHLAFFPNQWPETFSYTLSHAFRFGLWPIVTDMGAPAERVRAAGFGTVLEVARVGEILDAILDLTVTALSNENISNCPSSYTTTLEQYLTR
ncbi:glycosyltransferase [Nitrosomonas sp. Is37]|uniref:glycosyltransferase n=1 Tax=Nitrosomonas sp. Is37 TaxID=3080535 RepID=UPI00294B4C86|nr:glycosyltransferase [Nitrosomonas sp. Is37]MDV6344322.1 glycosyltransferase [Nitrosomonas sp. Is37]